MRPHKLFWMALLGTGGVPTPYNEATGGQISAPFQVGDKWFRSHTFTGSGTFTVISAVNPFTVSAIGAGGSGGGGFIGAAGYGGAGGGGGGGFEKSVTLAEGATNVTVGAGGPASGYNGGGTTGGSTVFGNLLTVGGGGGGQNGQSIQDSGLRPTPGGKGSEGGTSDGGTGGNVTFPGKPLRDALGLGTVGNGGYGGGQSGPDGGGPGAAGAVVVTYEVAPAGFEPPQADDPYQQEPFYTVAEIDPDTDEVMNLIVANEAWLADNGDGRYVVTPDPDGDEASIGGYYVGGRFTAALDNGANRKETP